LHKHSNNISAFVLSLFLKITHASNQHSLPGPLSGYHHFWHEKGSVKVTIFVWGINSRKQNQSGTRARH